MRLRHGLLCVLLLLLARRLHDIDRGKKISTEALKHGMNDPGKKGVNGARAVSVAKTRGLLHAA